MRHTHSFTYHPRYIMFLSQHFSFPLSVPSHQRSIPIFIYMLLLPEGKADEAWNRTKKQCCSGNRRASDRKLVISFLVSGLRPPASIASQYWWTKCMCSHVTDYGEGRPDWRRSSFCQILGSPSGVDEGTGVVSSCRRLKDCIGLIFRTKKGKSLHGLPKRRQLLWQTSCRRIRFWFIFVSCWDRSWRPPSYSPGLFFVRVSVKWWLALGIDGTLPPLRTYTFMAQRKQ